MTPTRIREFAKNLESIRADPNYTGLIDWFDGLILRTPAIFGVFVEDAQKELMKADLILKPGTTYTIKGQFLPQDKGLLKFAGSKNEASITTASWQPGEITFTVSGQQEMPAPIQVYDATDKTTVVAKTPGAYSIKKD